MRQVASASDHAMGGAQRRTAEAVTSRSGLGEQLGECVRILGAQQPWRELAQT